MLAGNGRAGFRILSNELVCPGIEIHRLSPVTGYRVRLGSSATRNRGADMACSECGAGNHNRATCTEVRRCSGCGKAGHNIQTCPQARRCSKCGSYQHDLRTCPQR